MKLQADTHRTEREFEIGDWILLKLQKYRQQSIQSRENHKLSPKFYGPFKLLNKVGKVVYKLSLHSNSQIHDVVHVSQLRKFHGALPVATHIPEWLHNHTLSDIQPQAILDRRSVKFQNKAITQYLIQWVDFADHEATWRMLMQLKLNTLILSNFRLEDKSFFVGGGYDIVF